MMKLSLNYIVIIYTFRTELIDNLLPDIGSYDPPNLTQNDFEHNYSFHFHTILRYHYIPVLYIQECR